MTFVYHHDFSHGLSQKYERVASRLVNPCTVLEVGCHTGYFSQFLMKQGHKVIGLEQNEQAAAMARASGVAVIWADVEHPDTLKALLPNRFDVVLLMDVIEHLRFPDRAVASVKQLLTPGGRVIITGPNVANWDIRKNLLIGRWEYADAGILDRTHLHFYTASGWRSLVERAGYRISEFGSADGLVPAVHWLGLIPPLRRYLPALHELGVKLLSSMFTIDYLIEATPLEQHH